MKPKCIDGKPCQGTHPTICESHGCAILQARANRNPMSDLQSKTDGELNVMLAELVGWKSHPPFKGQDPNSCWDDEFLYNQFSRYPIPPDGELIKNGKLVLMPLFCASLDEVARVEAGLIYDQPDHTKIVRYETLLCDNVEWPIRSSARQRTIALISTLTKTP